MTRLLTNLGLLDHGHVIGTVTNRKGCGVNALLDKSYNKRLLDCVISKRLQIKLIHVKIIPSEEEIHGSKSPPCTSWPALRTEQTHQ